MGANACSAEKDSGCCSGGKDGPQGPPMPTEYAQTAEKDVKKEEVEAAWPKKMPEAAVSGGSARGGSARKEKKQESEAIAGANDSYFVIELAELNKLPPGPDGERPIHKFESGATYLGQWRNNKRHGFGTHSWSDGASFSGQWKDNVVSGVGRFVHVDGDVFVGEWKSNVAEGFGIYYHRQGLMSYSGYWERDLQHGHGVESWRNGSQYRGQFVHGKKHGHGVYEWPDASKYSGQWKCNAANGFGHYVGKDGREFQGMWKDSLIHGCGSYKWPDGRTYAGQYVQDLKEGFGIASSEEGEVTKGYWLGSKLHGHAILYDKAGQRQREVQYFDGEEKQVESSPAKKVTENYGVP
eukprot:TRINITY_DN34051_c0_g1_i1.p1 TRINITY_DN34051_c0_g1~~TRINITY_DN34051_c0_g1_i1.p1  ORF type:complete len:352 (-),score=76.31 TRINITY_DN34051_c0_g1_i1:248-1303(-)